INYREEDFSKVALEATGGEGVDVVLDMVGGDYIPKNIASLRPDGRLVFIAFLNGPQAQVNFLPVMVKRLTVTGSTLRARPVEFKSAIAAALNERLWPQFAARSIAPVIDSRYPLAQAEAAHRRLDEGRHIGKILLTI
ncbi:MAG: zinc-binding dehydrogenase, partial [Ferrovibrionaceae bacterium]